MIQKYKDRVIYRQIVKFCKARKISVEEVLYGCCEGRLSNFPYWYVDYINKYRSEIQNRIKTGVSKRFDYKDVWS